MPSIVIMAGGTGGHVFPGLAVAQELEQRKWQINWFGTADKMEAQIVPKFGYDIHFLDIAGLRGKGLLVKLTTPFKLLKAIFAARRILKKLKPDVVLGMGGYASGPGGIAAYTLGIPIVLHEQNAVFGLTNRYLAKIASLVLCGFDTSVNPQLSKAPKTSVYVGNPIREGFNHITPKASVQSQALNVLIVGGSLGALALNQIVPKVLKEMSGEHEFNVWHQTGATKSAPVNDDYAEYANIVAKHTNEQDESVQSKAKPQVMVTEFIEDVEQAYEWADVVICRAGALTVAEVAAAGRVAIFVPLPIAVDDHQTQNAENLAKQGAAIVIQQPELESTLKQSLTRLFTENDYRENMAQKAKKLSQPEATQKVADYCASLIGKPNLAAKEASGGIK